MQLHHSTFKYVAQIPPLFIAALLLAGCLPTQNETYNPELSHSDLVGTWEGKWDHIFSVRFVITQKAGEQGYDVIYEWEEKRGNARERRQRKATVVNSNTLDAENIFISIDPWNPSRALAFGTFSSRTRVAELTRQ